MEVKELKKIANNNRKRIVDMVYRAKVGHVGGALSVSIWLLLYQNWILIIHLQIEAELFFQKGMLAPLYMQSWFKKAF